MPQSEVLVALAHARWRLGVSLEGETFAVGDELPSVALPLRGRDSMRAELAAAYRRTHGKPPTSAALTDALAVLEGDAMATDRSPLHVRVARPDPETVVLDLGDESGALVVVTASGWELRDNPGVLFRRNRATGRLPRPVRGGDLGELRELLNVTDASWPLVLGWLVAALIEDLPHPILALLGEQGTGKSTAQRLISRTVDPSPAQLRTAPRDVEQWIVAANATWVVALDNVSGISPALSDALCRAVTGDGLFRRRLYTDSDVSVVTLRRVVMLSAIDPGDLRGDLADRLITVELDRIGPSSRRQETTLEQAFADAHPRILGALLDLLAAVLNELPHVHLDELPRMADFATVLAAVDRVLGLDGLATYLAQSRRLAEVVVESDPVAEAIVALVIKQGLVEASAGEILEMVLPPRPTKSWPSSARGMAERLTRTAPALREMGLEVEPGRRGHGGKRIWRLAVLGDELKTELSPPSPRSPSTIQGEPLAGSDSTAGVGLGDDGDGPVDGLSGAIEVSRDTGSCPGLTSAVTGPPAGVGSWWWFDDGTGLPPDPAWLDTGDEPCAIHPITDPYPPRVNGTYRASKGRPICETCAYAWVEQLKEVAGAAR